MVSKKTELWKSWEWGGEGGGTERGGGRVGQGGGYAAKYGMGVGAAYEQQ